MAKVIAGKYELLGVIGEGGMGRVWRARRTSDDRELALKFVDASRAKDVRWRRRFEREARLLSKLGQQSPHIVRIEDHDFESENGPFVAMELLSGETLGERLGEDVRMSARDVARIIGELCAALDVAHRAGVIHRDVKPANIFLHRVDGGSEIVKLLDFGVAKVEADGEQTATRDRLALGTPQYMSPEQFSGEASVDARTDLWSVGVVAYRMLVGHGPFSRGPAAELAARILGQEPARPSTLVASLPTRIDGWFARALAKRPRDRFSDASELSSALSAALADSSKADPLEFRVKGGALRATVNVIREKYGAELLEKILSQCSAETNRVLRASILVSSFYPGAVFIDVSRAAVRVAGPDVLRRLGALSAEEALGPGGFLELFVKLSVPRGASRFLESSTDIFRLYYDRGAWEVEEMGNGWARCRFVDGARFPPEVLERLLGYLERGLVLVGARGVTLHTDARDPDVIVRIEWRS